MPAKTGWTRVAFGDVAQLVRERSSDPEGDGVERYVGLEHIDSGNLTIRRWGSVADGTTFTNVFRAGQVLFGKRRAYQRKVAVADFDGVCSGDIYVFEPKGDGLLPELLPFICQTDRFFEHAVGTSAGSLSPRTNWDSLAEFEFPLPPIDEQRRIATALRLADDSGETLAALIRKATVARESWLEAELETLSLTCPVVEVSTLVDRITVGIVVKPADLYVKYGSGVPALRSLNVAPGRVVMEDVVHISHQGHLAHEKSRLSPGDVVIVRSGRPGDAAVIPSGLGELNCIDLIICGQGDDLHPEYLCAILNARFGRRQFSAGAAGTAQQHFNVGAFKRIRVPVATRDVQSKIVTTLRSFDAAASEARSRATAVAILRSRLLSVGLPA